MNHVLARIPEPYQLLARKVLVAFLTGFAAALLTTLAGLGKEPTFGWDKSFVISAVFGALSAGARAVLALSPLNLVPSDGLHTLGGKAAAASPPTPTPPPPPSPPSPPAA